MRQTMRFLPALAASLALAACGGGSYGSSSPSQAGTTASGSHASKPASSSAGTGAVVKTASNATLRATVLTDAHGRTLYRLSGELSGKFICTSAACLGVWHPVSASAAGAPTGSVGSLGTAKRPDGTEQVSYKGLPLYTFAGDRQPGDAKGQGLKDVGTWMAVTIGEGGAPATHTSTASRSAPAAPPSSSRGGYGY